MSENKIPVDEFPGLYKRYLTERITWRFYKHWAQGYLAGEGITEHYGDRSGCLQMINGLPYVNVPRVVQARLYESAKGWVSAVYSYPHGIGLEDHYFWEIYAPGLIEEPERFDTEREMEKRIQEVLA